MMKRFNEYRVLTVLVIIAAMVLSLTGCSMLSKDSGDPAYEAQVVTFEGLKTADNSDVSISEITISELRQLPQYKLDASYKRTTGLYEEFKMSGPYLREVIEKLGGDLDDYAGIGVVGSDGYYCLLSREVIQAVPDLMLALVIDKKARLDEDNAPARLAVQGQFGPYWVKRVEKVILYEEIPEKVITSVWVFPNLAAGIEPYEYEYYGSKDDAIDLEQIFSRLDNVDSKSFFTMKSSDGFKKNEVINMVKSRYYIKVEGADAPTNVSPYIKLGMNVQNIAWVSTNADAAVFPAQLEEYMDKKTIDGQEGIPLDEVLYETEVKAVQTENFDILGTAGEKITVKGEDMSRGILVTSKESSTGVIWEKDTGYQNIDNLLRIRLVPGDPSLLPEKEVEEEESAEQISGIAADKFNQPGPDTILTLAGNGLNREFYLSLDDLKSLPGGYAEECYSLVNNYPTRKFMSAKGIDLIWLLNQAGLKNSARSILVEASDGYKAAMTREQLLSKRYRYPELLKGSTAGGIAVKPILAWATAEGQDLSKVKEGDLRLAVGQIGLNDVNTAVGVQMVAKITVSNEDKGRWEKPSAVFAGGQITLNHDFLDQVKLYYTLDGTEPSIDSNVYNPSTTYFQPDLIKPIDVSSSGTLKVKVVGYGKGDSEVLIYDF